jgi:hypothetical protein
MTIEERLSVRDELIEGIRHAMDCRAYVSVEEAAFCLVSEADERVAQLQGMVDGEQQARKRAEAVIQRFSAWLDAWATSGASGDPREVYTAWDKARSGE